MKAGGAVYGIGIDILSLSRIKAVQARHPQRFAARLLHPQERIEFRKAKQPERFLAKAFAAKEAFVKALGTGFRGVAHADVGLKRGALGRPELVYSAALQRKLKKLGISAGFVSLSDEGDLVIAMVVLGQ